MVLPTTSVTFSCSDPALQRLYDEAERKALGNLRPFGSDLVLVEGGGYEKIWLETQPMGGEMYAFRNLEAALNNTLLFMRHQRADGRIPGSIQCMDGQVTPQFNKFQGFCFPYPALNLYYLIGRNPDYLDQLADCLRRFDEYLWRVRNIGGCLNSFCVYDTGEDNAVRYGDAPCWWTEDAPPEGYAVVPMASMDIMSFSYACRDTLCAISRIKGDGREAFWREKADHVALELRRILWDERRGACFDRDKDGHVIDVLTHNNLRCMYWGSFSQDMADRFVKEHLLNPAEFFTPMPLPSVAANDPAFRNIPQNNWSGQPEGLTYQRAIRALENYGYDELVPVFGKRLFRAVMDGGYVFTQQFDPYTGAPSMVPIPAQQSGEDKGPTIMQDAYGPTILSVMEYIAHIWGVHQQLGEVWFSLGSRLAYACEQHWGEHSYRIESDGSTAQIRVDGKEIYSGACGIRLITDEQGRLLRNLRIEKEGASA